MFRRDGERPPSAGVAVVPPRPAALRLMLVTVVTVVVVVAAACAVDLALGRPLRGDGAVGATVAGAVGGLVGGRQGARRRAAGLTPMPSDARVVAPPTVDRSMLLTGLVTGALLGGTAAAVHLDLLLLGPLMVVVGLALSLDLWRRARRLDDRQPTYVPLHRTRLGGTRIDSRRVFAQAAGTRARAEA